MERGFNQHFYKRQWNNQVLPVVFYLTLPTVSCSKIPERAMRKETKSQRQKLRDTTRLNNFIQRKSVCSLLPFYNVDNQEIQNMIPRQQPSLVQSKTIQKDAENQLNKIRELQEEISFLGVIVENEKRKHAALQKGNSDLKTEINKLQKNIKDAENVTANLQRVADTAHRNLKSAEVEILNLKKELLQKETKQKETEIVKDEMSNKFNREIENNERIRKEYSTELKGLKAEIRILKSQVINSESVQMNCKQSATNVATINGTSGTKCSKSNKRVSKGTFHQSLSSTTTGHDHDPQCNRCGSLYSFHQPNQCPAKNFLCGYCSKRGHHTLNCLQDCRGCEAKGRLYHKIEDCMAQDMNCAYCNVRGHLTHMCLQKRYDTEGF